MDGQYMDFFSDPSGRDKAMRNAGGAGAARPFLGVMFACCNVYSRVYQTADGTGYRGGCPRCGRLARFRVGPGGSSSRFFQAE